MCASLFYNHHVLAKIAGKVVCLSVCLPVCLPVCLSVYCMEELHQLVVGI